MFTGQKIRLFKSLLILLLACTAVWGADSNKLVVYPPQKIMPFRGLDSQSSSPMIEDSRAIDLQNVKLTSAFDLTKRPGYQMINDTLDDLDMDSPAITGIFDATFSSGSNYVLAFLGSKLKYNNSGVWETVTGTATLNADQNNLWDCVMALDNAVCTNNVNPIIKIIEPPVKSVLDFSSLTAPVTKAKAVIFYRNYLIAGNTVENGVSYPTRARWSNVGTIELWDDADYVDIGALAGDEIIGFAELYGNLYVFLKRSIWKVTLVGGNEIFTLDEVIHGTGAVSRESIQTIRFPDGQIGIGFLDEEKRIWAFNGTSIVNMGSRIQETLDALNEARLAYAVSIFDGGNYILSVSSGSSTTNDVLLIYNTDIGEWTKYKGINANALARVRESSLVKTYFGNYKAFVYWMDNPSLYNDVDGAVGIIDSVTTVNTGTATGAQMLIDSGLTAGIYTGATVRITGGTGSGGESVVLSNTSTGIIVATSFSVTPDNTSAYSIGDIDAYYQTKWYDFGDSSRKKNFKEIYLWSASGTNNYLTVSYKTDFEGDIESILKTFVASGAEWDSAIWDTSTWASSAEDAFERVNAKGVGRLFSVKFSNSDIDQTFKLYGFSLLADALDIR